MCSYCARSHTLSQTIANVSTRLYVLYVASGSMGIAEAMGLALLNGFLSTTFPKDSASAFSVVRATEAYLIGTIILISGSTVYYVPIAILIVFSCCSMVCICVLFVRLRRATTDTTTTTKTTTTSTTTTTTPDAGASTAASVPGRAFFTTKNPIWRATRMQIV